MKSSKSKDAAKACSRCGKKVRALSTKGADEEILCKSCRSIVEKTNGGELVEKKGDVRSLEITPTNSVVVGREINGPYMEKGPYVGEDVRPNREEPQEVVMADEEIGKKESEDKKAGNEEKSKEEAPLVEEDAQPIEDEPEELEKSNEGVKKGKSEKSENEMIEEEMAEEVATEKTESHPKSQKRGVLDETVGAIFPMEKEMPVMKAGLAKMITPLFFGSLITGVFLSIPLLNLLFIPIILLGSAVSIILLRAGGYFKEVVSVESGIKIGVLTSFFAVFVSTFLLIALEVLFAHSVYVSLVESFPSIAPGDIDLVLKICGLDKDLFLSVLRLRFAACLIIYPIIGGIGGAIFAKYMR